jgi:hypothetical protein
LCVPLQFFSGSVVYPHEQAPIVYFLFRVGSEIQNQVARV